MIMYLHVSFWLKMDPSKVPKRFKSIAFSILFVLYLLRLSNDNPIQGSNYRGDLFFIDVISTAIATDPPHL